MSALAEFWFDEDSEGGTGTGDMSTSSESPTAHEGKGADSMSTSPAVRSTEECEGETGGKGEHVAGAEGSKERFGVADGKGGNFLPSPKHFRK